ncbi:hypothetical protein JCM10908_000985 [Rhodotorula pacifica]|uniref:uncharacterized protein n=1 Tax=Rhodotorula pacifica TaxID=1495444 RepID=UPI003178978B
MDAAPPVCIDTIPPELLHRILELAVDGLPSTIRIRASWLRNFSLVAQAWREPAQTLLESRVHIDSYHRARAFFDRPRRLERPLVLDELVLFFDFAPQDDDFFPLTEFMTRSICQLDCTVKFLHLRSALFLNAFDVTLLKLPAFRELRHLKLDMPLEPPPDVDEIPLRLRALSLSAMMDQPTSLLRLLLPASSNSLTSLHLFVIKDGAPLHERVLDAQPALPSSLLHLSIATHWVPLSDSLIRFIASCTRLRTINLSGIIPLQLLDIIGVISSPLASLDFTVTATFAWHGYTVESFFDRILREQSARDLRFLTAKRFLESRSDDKPARTQVVRGNQACLCVHEITARRPLP